MTPAKVSRSSIPRAWTNSAGGVKEIYYSNGGMLDMDKQCVSSEGGMTAKAAAEMGMKPTCWAIIRSAILY